MSLHDNLFVEDAQEDLEHFLKSDKRKRVLIFPPVNNYRRFLIHQLVQDNFSDLQTFSIGQGFARRTVVCYKSDFLGPPQVNGVLSQDRDIFPRKASHTMGIESQCTPTASPEHSIHRPRQTRSTPTLEIYRPPAMRRARLEQSPAAPPLEQHTAETCVRATRPKRPDRAVYVPRHRRSATHEVDSSAQNRSSSPKERSPANWKRPIDKVSTVRTIISQDTPIVMTEIAMERLENPTEPAETQSPTKITNSSTVEEASTTELEDEKMDEDAVASTEATNSTLIDSSLIQNEELKIDESPICLDESDKRDRRKSNESNNDCSSSSEVQNTSKTILTETCDLIISDDETNICQPKICKQVSSPQRLEDKTQNERNNEVANKASITPVLIISSKSDEESNSTKSTSPVIPMTPPEKKVKKVERPKSKPAPPPVPPTKLNRDECDWDSLFDDNGDCLDPTLIEELTSAVGEVVIEKPKSSYKSVSRPIEVSNDEFGHVLEIYNFPSEFKTSDLAAVFSPFRSGGFELKWVDDTHCLGVFSSPLVAAEVLASDHPFVKTRPLSEATALSKTKVRKSSEFLQPYRSRPETCAALARRLVTKSLGVTLATARQEREQEKIVLREAKEKRRLANKQRDDIWEGIIADKPTS